MLPLKIIVFMLLDLARKIVNHVVFLLSKPCYEDIVNQE
jgi:hypothetical protein